MKDLSTGESLCSVVAENIVIATVLSSQDVIKAVMPILTSPMFYTALHGQIFDTCVELFDSGGYISPDSVYQHMATKREMKGLQPNLSDRAAIFALYENHLPSPSIVEYAELIREKYKSRKYRDFCREAQGIFQEQEFTEAITWFEKKLVEFRGLQANTEHTKSMYDVMGEEFIAITKVAEARETGNIHESILPTGFRDLDHALDDGIPRQRLISVLGSTAMGKTTLLLELLTYTSLVMQQPSLFFSLEMSSNAQAQKLFSKHAQIPCGALQSGKVPNDKWGMLIESQQNYHNLPMKVNDRVRTIEDIISVSRQFYSEHGQIGMIGIDYLTLVRTADKRMQKRDRVDYVLEELNQLKKELDTRIVVLCQIGRDVKQSADKRPTIYSAKESGGIEEASDLIYGCYRDEYFNPDTRDRGILELIVLKNRYGRTGTVKLLWDGANSTIANLRANHGY
jgi:replicative DNA helicase